ncbi:SU10 major capsid protein, partial [Streptomyces hydrogenans]
MAAVTGQGTTYNLPNYHGDLYKVTPTETPFLAAIGGLSGGKRTKSTEFEWQTMDRRSSTANNSALEGANAPTGVARSRSAVSNVVEIHQSAVEVSYTRQAATGMY